MSTVTVLTVFICFTGNILQMLHEFSVLIIRQPYSTTIICLPPAAVKNFRKSGKDTHTQTDMHTHTETQ